MFSINEKCRPLIITATILTSNYKSMVSYHNNKRLHVSDHDTYKNQTKARAVHYWRTREGARPAYHAARSTDCCCY